ncbi:MAG: dTMP kinase [Hyphomicrobiales bacterium]|nr:MAG: dTMP kinase [Hyphomicrobiales bacterium]
MRGKFITFEGGEGSGKSTQVSRLAERLKDAGYAVVETREPGGSPKAEAIRKFILAGEAEGKGPRAEAMLFAAARMDHVDRKIRPALETGKWVVCDRFMDSTRVYQGMHVDGSTIDLLEKMAVGDCRPELTVLLDISAKEGLDRAIKRSRGARRDRFEKEDVSVHEARREAFLKLAESQPERFVVLDATKFPRALELEIWDACQKRFNLS